MINAIIGFILGLTIGSLFGYFVLPTIYKPKE